MESRMGGTYEEERKIRSNTPETVIIVDVSL